MKPLLTILLMSVLWSCSKDDCEQCTRTWQYKSYTLTGTNGHSNIQEYDGGKETFAACGDDMIEAEEQTRTSYTKNPVPNETNKWIVVEGTGTCNCQ